MVFMWVIRLVIEKNDIRMMNGWKRFVKVLILLMILERYLLVFIGVICGCFGILSFFCVGCVILIDVEKLLNFWDFCGF